MWGTRPRLALLLVKHSNYYLRDFLPGLFTGHSPRSGTAEVYATGLIY